MPATSISKSFGPRRGGVLVLLGVFLLGACTNEAKPSAKQTTQTANPESGMKMVVIPVEGMSCVACTARVKKTVGSIDGVGDVKVSLGERNARVRFDPSRLSSDRLVAAINGLGYQAGAPVENKH